MAAEAGGTGQAETTVLASGDITPSTAQGNVSDSDTLDSWVMKNIESFWNGWAARIKEDSELEREALKDFRDARAVVVETLPSCIRQIRELLSVPCRNPTGDLAHNRDRIMHSERARSQRPFSYLYPSAGTHEERMMEILWGIELPRSLLKTSGLTEAVISYKGSLGRSSR